MSVETNPVQGREHSASPSAPQAVPVRRVIAGSLVAGAVTALVLMLVVFPGATESTITGSALLGFGFGWAMMRVLSARFTSQPQQWTTVPAVAMTAAGAGLLVLAPGDSTLTTLGWVWPAAMLALVGWMYVAMRRALTGKGRWLLTSVLVVLALTAVGGTVEDVAAVRIGHTYPAPGRTYAVGDHRLHLDCRGQGGPTVVLFNGLGEFSASWARITEPVSATTRVCAYDRAGQGWSDDAGKPQDGVAAAADLHALLAAAGEHGPYVLVGHSIGGPYALDYAESYPDDVAGMVLLDSSSPRQFTDVDNYALQYRLMRRGLALLPMLARIGLGPVTAPGSHLPGPDAAVVDAMSSTPRAARNGRDELSTIPRVFEEAQAVTTLGDRPLMVLATSESLALGGWVAAQDRLAALSTDSVRRDVESTHAGVVEDAPGAVASVRAITDVVHAVSAGTPLATP
jgi:pimeloyl-ACP methyl ester carboxylesterase